MRIPALRAHIGDWTYYVSTLTFEQVCDSVSRIDDELHKSEGLRDLIQRSISNNYLKIRDYILNQPELFFNSLVLAVYDNYPNWREIEFTYAGEETYQMGLLEFPGAHKIFPVDGQHRVEGIKAALAQNAELKDQRVAVIFIGHTNDSDGMRRTRRLFTTLNRYAKPVLLDDIIALDEDDVVAITTRYLLEDFDLFSGTRIVNAKQKSIPTNNSTAITSIITLYQANVELLRYFYKERRGVKLTPTKQIEYLKYRPEADEVAAFKDFCVSYWTSFRENIQSIAYYAEIVDEPAAGFRNNVTGGNILFRPIGFLPFVKATLLIKERTNETIEDVHTKFSAINLELDQLPWLSVVWDPVGHKMIMSAGPFIEKLFIYLYDKALLTDKEMASVKAEYGAKTSRNEVEVDAVLDQL